MAHRAFDEQMLALDALKGLALDAAAITLVAKALDSRSNFIVAKAARLAEDNQRSHLMPSLITAFERFFLNGEKTDPQCWAKNALSRALSKLGCRDSEVFLRGLHYKQMEPVWGGRSDSAGPLRANCAHGLVACEGLIAQDVLLLMLPLLADDDTQVRVEAVRALTQLSDLAVPVLRVRALIPDPEAEVMAACFGALTAIERDRAIPFLAQFLPRADEAAAEAAFALAETHAEAALAELIKARGLTVHADAWFDDALLYAIALTRLPQAVEFLAELVEREDRVATSAMEALVKVNLGPDIRLRLQRAVDMAGSPRLRKALAETLCQHPALPAGDG